MRHMFQNNEPNGTCIRMSLVISVASRIELSFLCNMCLVPEERNNIQQEHRMRDIKREREKLFVCKEKSIKFRHTVDVIHIACLKRAGKERARSM